MKNIKRKRRRRPPSQLLGPAIQPKPPLARSAPARTHAAQLPAQVTTTRPRARLRQLPLPLGPTRQPHDAHARVFPRSACSRCHAGPASQPPRPQCRLPHPRLDRLRDRRPTAVAEAGQGVTPGTWPCLLGAAPTQPLRRAYATAREPLDATNHATTARSPSAMGARSSAIKARPRMPLRSSHHPPPRVANHFAPKNRGLRRKL
jgi:hypothetical protein